MAAASVWRPESSATRILPGRSKQVASFCALGAAAFAALSGHQAFAGVSQVSRPAGQLVVTDSLPRGLVCREASGELVRKQEVWDPVVSWHGESTWTASPQLQADYNRQWYHFDAERKTLGHLAQAIASLLVGKDNPLYDDKTDVGSFIVVTNCEKVRVSGKKFHYKLYFRNILNRPGGTKVERFKDLQRRFPERIIMRAVWGMMPKTPTSRRIFKERLKLFMGPNHLYYHQQPIEYPMHMVKECTHTSNLRLRDRMAQRITKVWPRLEAKATAKEEKTNQKRLKQFQEFLIQQLEQEGPEAAQRMQLDDLLKKAQSKRFNEVLVETEGKPVIKRKKKVYLGLDLVKEPINSPNRGYDKGAR